MGMVGIGSGIGVGFGELWVGEGGMGLLLTTTTKNITHLQMYCSNDSYNVSKITSSHTTHNSNI